MSRSYIPKALRELVARQAHYRCGYCLTQEAVVGTPMEVDHTIPEALGGLTEEENLWLACSLCNEHKSDRIAALDPESGEIVRLFDPRHDVWHRHFVWTTDGERIVGLDKVLRRFTLPLLWRYSDNHCHGERSEPSRRNTKRLQRDASLRSA